MMSKRELHDEFWLLTKGVLEDSRIDTDEAKVLKRWLEEHQQDGEFGFAIGKLEGILSDGYVDRFESKEIIDALGHILSLLNVKEGA